MAAVGGDRSQRADGAAAASATGRVVGGAAQAAAIPDFQHPGPGGAPCARRGVEVGDERGASGGLAGRLEPLAPADMKGGLISGLEKGCFL